MAKFISIEPGVMVNLDQIVTIQSKGEEVQLKMSDGSEYALAKQSSDRFWELLHADGNRILDGTQPEAETICDLEVPQDLLSFEMEE